MKNVAVRCKRVGCGEAADMARPPARWQTEGRSGGSIRPGFEGGQMPLYRKLPHRGFNNYEFRTSYAVVNVGDLAALDAKLTEVNAEVLAAAGLIRPGVKLLKILGDGEISRALKVTAQKFTGSAKAKLEKAGGRPSRLRRRILDGPVFDLAQPLNWN